MTRLHLMFSTLVLLGAAGCPTREKYGRTPSVLITAPTIATTYTNGVVHLAAAIDPPLALPIVLSDNGARLAELTPPTYSFDWSTAGVAEGPHMIVAEVAFSDET